LQEKTIKGYLDWVKSLYGLSIDYNLMIESKLQKSYIQKRQNPLELL